MFCHASEKHNPVVFVLLAVFIFSTVVLINSCTYNIYCKSEDIPAPHSREKETDQGNAGDDAVTANGPANQSGPQTAPQCNLIESPEFNYQVYRLNCNRPDLRHLTHPGQYTLLLIGHKDCVPCKKVITQLRLKSADLEIALVYLDVTEPPEVSSCLGLNFLENSIPKIKNGVPYAILFNACGFPVEHMYYEKLPAGKNFYETTIEILKKYTLIKED